MLKIGRILENSGEIEKFDFSPDFSRFLPISPDFSRFFFLPMKVPLLCYSIMEYIGLSTDFLSLLFQLIYS